MHDVYRESLEIVDYLRKQPTYKPVSTDINQETVRQIETSIEKNDPNDTLIIKTKAINTQVNVDTSKLSKSFLLVYNSVTSVLRDHGLI